MQFMPTPKGIAAGCVLFLSIFISWNAPARAGNGGKISAGDAVGIDFTCRRITGEILLTTVQKMADGQSQRKAFAFSALKTYQPLTLVAGQGEHYSGIDPLKVFDQAIAAQLSEQVVGLRKGDHRIIEISAPVPEGLKASERYVRLAKIQTRPRIMKRSRHQFRGAFGKAPALGMEVPVGVGLMGKIIEMDDSTVTVQVLITPGAQAMTPWGRAALKEEEDRVIMSIHPEIGRLVKTGPFMGRVSAVGEDMFTVDFGYPFGEEKVVCEFTIVNVKENSDMSQ